MLFRQARHYYRGRISPVRMIVVHATATPRDRTARGVANYFATTIRKASAHCITDNNETWECVKPWDTAFGATSANADGYHIEHIGTSRESRAEWLDGYGYPMLVQSAQVAASRALEWDIPVRWLTVNQVRDRKTKGFTDHATVQKAFPSTGHTDPGTGFPHDVYLDLVRSYMIPQEDDMAKVEDHHLAMLEEIYRALFDNAGHIPGGGMGAQKEGSALYLLQNMNHRLNVVEDRLDKLDG